MSLPPEPLNEVYLLYKFDVCSFSMTGDIQIFKLVILLTLSSLKLILILPTLSSLKLILILLTLARSKLTLLFHFSRLGAGHIYFTDFGQEINEKRSKPSLFDKKIQELCIGSGTSHFHWFNQWKSRTGFPS